MYVSNHEFEIERTSTNGDSAKAPTVAGDLRSVGGLQLDVVGSLKALLRGRREDGEKGATVDEPLLVSSRVGNVKEVIVVVWASNVVHVS